MSACAPRMPESIGEHFFSSALPSGTKGLTLRSHCTKVNTYYHHLPRHNGDEEEERTHLETSSLAIKLEIMCHGRKCLCDIFSCFISSSAVYIALAPPTFTSFVFCSENVSDCCGAAAEDFSHVHNTHKSTSSSPHSMMSLMLVIKVTLCFY